MLKHWPWAFVILGLVAAVFTVYFYQSTYNVNVSESDG